MDIHRYTQKIGTQCERLKLFGDGPLATGFKTASTALSMSVRVYAIVLNSVGGLALLGGASFLVLLTPLISLTNAVGRRDVVILDTYLRSVGIDLDRRLRLIS
jgi:hypothetical protein